MSLTVTLDRTQVRDLLTFCARKGLKEFCIVRDEDEGALVGATRYGEYNVVYFPGCDPNKYPDWHAVMHEFAGPDEFTHTMPLTPLHEFLRALSGRATGLRITADIDNVHVTTVYGGEHARA